MRNRIIGATLILVAMTLMATRWRDDHRVEGELYFGVTDVSAAGTNQSGATALGSILANVTTCTAATADGVKLPDATAGRTQIILANCGATVGVWPAGTDAINGGSASAEDNLVDGAVGMYFATATGWMSNEQ